MSQNKEKLCQVFAESLAIDIGRVTDDLRYASIPEWDSVAHMALIAAIESAFDIMMDTEDVIDMSSVGKACEILAKYGVVL
ncbi:acyl carrier protein [Uliginosibacterium gangwonense]|uniref:acyl carrier protein n=1 Tax=Uliginosibacterium gangwonense TaxID=392736 RepID=UPI00036E7088|nr:acyl carrier protein [Uliginosibacterium gangwonense]